MPTQVPAGVVGAASDPVRGVGSGGGQRPPPAKFLPIIMMALSSLDSGVWHSTTFFFDLAQHCLPGQPNVCLTNRLMANRLVVQQTNNRVGGGA